MSGNLLFNLKFLLISLLFCLKLYGAGSSSTPRVEGWRAFRRKSNMANVDVVRAEATVGPRSPTVYDWVVISSLDR